MPPEHEANSKDARDFVCFMKLQQRCCLIFSWRLISAPTTPHRRSGWSGLFLYVVYS